MLYFVRAVSLLFSASLLVISAQRCEDSDNACASWKDYCGGPTTSYVVVHCKKTCGNCPKLEFAPPPEKYDTTRLPAQLQPLSFLVGRWRSDFGGKVIFPTIPVFTYGEELDISLADQSPGASGPLLNYSAISWGINDGFLLHSEYGFVTAEGSKVSMNIVMNNGFTTIEEGDVFSQEMNIRLKDIGRISFSRDLPVTGLSRKYKRITETHLEQILQMETLTHDLQEHTRILYEKVFP